MKDYERREPELYNFYEELGIPYLASDERVIIELQKKEQEAINLKDKNEQAFIKLAREYIGTTHKRREQYDNYLKRHGVKFPLTKREKKIKLIKKAIIGGTIVAVGLTGVILTTNYIQNKKQENLASNVCVEYTVEEGIGNKKLDDMFYEYGYASYAVSGADRNLSSNGGSPFEGDVIVGRTSEEKANELVEDHNAEIISPEEAISLLEENNSLVGEFKKTADGDNSFNWDAAAKAKTKL